MPPLARSISVAAMLFVGSVAFGATDGPAGQAPDQSGRDHSEPRELTYEEAHDLLTAFLKVSPLAVEQSGDMGYKGFYFFMADAGSLPCRPCARQGQKGVYVGNFQYYAVDRRTGDVWSSVFCERIERHAL